MDSQDDPSFREWSHKYRMDFDEGYSEEEMNAVIDSLNAQDVSGGLDPLLSHDAAFASLMVMPETIVHNGYIPKDAVSANPDGMIPPATSQGVAERSVASSQTATEMPQYFDTPIVTVRRRNGGADFVAPFSNGTIRSCPVKSSSTREKEFDYFSAAYDFASHKPSVPSLAPPMSTSLATMMSDLQTPSRTFERSPGIRTSVNRPRDSPGHRRTALSHMRTAVDGSSGGRPLAQQGPPTSFANLPISFQEAMGGSSYHRMAGGNVVWPSSPAEIQPPAWTPLSGGYGYNASTTSMVPRSYASGVDSSGMMTTAGYTGKPYSTLPPQRLNGNGPRPRDVPAITPHTHTAYRDLASPGAPPHAPVGLHQTATSDQMHPFYTPRLQPPAFDVVAQHTTQYTPQADLGVAPDALAGPAMLPQSPHKTKQTVTPAGSPAPSNARTPRSNPSMPGQRRGFPQDNKQHHRHCNPFSKTCAASCEYEANHPEKWELHGKKLYRLRAPASWQKKLPDGSLVTRRVPTGHIVSGLWLAFWGLDASQTAKVTKTEVQRHSLVWQTYAR
nr:hypothetical protein B0A51_14142 [Rachicladosporium sp. CCFEE 5018]